MQQTDRIELIKAAVELTKLTAIIGRAEYSVIATTFNSFMDLITVKYETILTAAPLDNTQF